jgi:GNAT superfamily N-acetyltransferase
MGCVVTHATSPVGAGDHHRIAEHAASHRWFQLVQEALMHLAPWSPDLAHLIAPLFSSDCPIPIRLWAVLEGTITGRIVVDQVPQPTLALVQEVTEGTTYLGGTPTRQTLTAAITLLRTTHKVIVCLWPDDPVRSILPDAPSYDGSAIDFTDRSPAVKLDRLGAVPAGYHLRRIDAAIVPTLGGFDYYVAMFGSIGRALEHTLGYCLLHGEAVVCEAIAGPLTRGVAEMGIGTAQPYRRRGFGTITAARTIQACEARGYQAFWNAAQQNVASVALARRLGFQTERPFRVLAWASVP